MLFDLAQHLAHRSLKSPRPEILPDIYFDILVGSLSDVLSDFFFWHFIRSLFGDSLWSRSGGERSDPEFAVPVRRGTLRSRG